MDPTRQEQHFFFIFGDFVSGGGRFSLEVGCQKQPSDVMMQFVRFFWEMMQKLSQRGAP